MIEARNSIHSLLETVQEQQEQFTNIASLCDTDAAIPVAFTKDNRVHIGPKMEMRLVVLGLDGAGKTSILFKMKQDEFVSPITTIGICNFLVAVEPRFNELSPRCNERYSSARPKLQ